MTFYYFVTFYGQTREGYGVSACEITFPKRISSHRDITEMQNFIKEKSDRKYDDVTITDFKLLRRSRY